MHHDVCNIVMCVVSGSSCASASAEAALCLLQPTPVEPQLAVMAEAEVVATIRLTLVPADLFQNETGGLQTCLIGCPLWLFLYLFVAALLIFLSCTLLTNAFYLPTDDFDEK